MKKLIILVITLFFILVGCSNGQKENSKESFIEGEWETSGYETKDYQDNGKVSTSDDGGHRTINNYEVLDSDDPDIITIREENPENGLTVEYSLEKIDENNLEAISQENSNASGDYIGSQSPDTTLERVNKRDSSGSTENSSSGGFFSGLWEFIKGIIVLAFLVFAGYAVYKTIKEKRNKQ